MASWDSVDASHVLSSINEYDELGKVEFLARYRFEPTSGPLLVHDGKQYDSNAILSVAYEHATGAPADSTELSVDEDETAPVLRTLGFDVVAAEEPDAAWDKAAREILMTHASRYHSVVTHKELGAEVQEKTGIHTKTLLHNWIGKVLTRVAEDCAGRGEPMLSSLCVNESGSVGKGYAKAVLTVRKEVPFDADDHAALERLACYRHFGAELPADGGRPALAPRLAATRSRVAKAKAVVSVGETCPHCHTAKSMSGICGNCD